MKLKTYFILTLGIPAFIGGIAFLVWCVKDYFRHRWIETWVMFGLVYIGMVVIASLVLDYFGLILVPQS